MKRALACLNLLATMLLVGALAGPLAPAAVAAPLAARHNEYGFNVFLIGNSSGAGFNNATMGKVQEAGFGWVRIQLQWRELEPSKGAYNTAPYDTMINAASGAGARVLVSVVKSPAWANPARPGALPTKDNTRAFGDTMRFLAARYKGKVQAWEIWNEPNLAGEVGGLVEVRPYFDTLKAGYSGVKAVDPGAVVVFAGLTPTTTTDRNIALDDVQYLKEFYSYSNGNGKKYFDVLGAHAGSAGNAPDMKWPENAGPGTCPPPYTGLTNCWNTSAEFYFRRVEDLRTVMEQYGESAKQVWLTEFGWDSCWDGDTALPAPSGYEYCQLNTEQKQAEYIQGAFTWAKDKWPWTGVLFLWNLNYQAIPGIQTTDEKYGWGVLRPDFSPRPAYDAVKVIAKP